MAAGAETDEIVAVGNSEYLRIVSGSPNMSAFVGGREAAEEGKDTGGPAEPCLKAYWAGSVGCIWPAEGCMHSRSLDVLVAGRGVQLTEGPCEAPSSVGRFVKLVASPFLAAGCGPFGFLVLHAGQRRPHSVPAAMLRKYASFEEMEVDR